MSHHTNHQHSKHQRRRTVTVHITPTLGTPFTLTCSLQQTIEKLKEDVSDKVGISPKKISLLLKSMELKTGTLLDNGVSDGSEIRLVPSLESGVNTTSATDPLAMMKHSMLGISDQQIDDFLAGKVPLSVAIRLGESVVVVNLNRAKVEDIEMEPPQEKRHASQSSRSSSSRSSSREKHCSSNPHWSSSAACTTTSSVTTPTCSVPVRSVIPVGTPIPSADVSSSPNTHLHGASNALDEHHKLLLHGSPLPTNRRRPRGDDSETPSSSPIPTGHIPTHIPSPPTCPAPSSSSSFSLPPPLVDQHATCVPPTSRVIKKARRSPGSKSKLHSPQSSDQWEELKRLREQASSTNNGISMKRKAVMEAIGEILKKMYSQRSKGKSPGTFKGRFSSEFTCDNEMQEIIHSRTTMTSYGGGASSKDHASSSSLHPRRSRVSNSCHNGCSHMTRERYEENETTRSKVELLKLKMQQRRMKRSNNSSAGGSAEGGVARSDAELEAPPTKSRKKNAFGGFKKGFLLSDNHAD